MVFFFIFSNLYILYLAIPIVFIEENFLSPLDCFNTLKNYLIIRKVYGGLFLNRLFCSIYFSVFCLNYAKTCGEHTMFLIVKHEDRKSLLILFFFVKIALVFLEIFHFHLSLRITLPLFTQKKCAVILGLC